MEVLNPLSDKSRYQNPGFALFRSHYQYKNWTNDIHGSRKAVTVRPIRPESADLINTCIYNPAKKTYTVYCMTIDLDVERASDQWKNKTGQLSWHKINKELKNRFPILSDFIGAAIRSSGGRGLALMIPISPLELTHDTSRAQRAASVLLKKLIEFLNIHQMGADPAAFGLIRDFCNWRNPERQVHWNDQLMPMVQSSRFPVVKTLLEAINKLPEFVYIKKRNLVGQELLHHDRRVEIKLAFLFNDLWNLKDQDASLWSFSTGKDMANKYKLSHPFMCQFLKKPPSWLKISRKNKFQGVSLSFEHECINLEALKRRSDALLDSDAYGFDLDESKSNGGVFLSQKAVNCADLCSPAQVEDGKRNSWLTKAALLLKHEGVDEYKASEIVQRQSRSIPGSSTSRNCRAALGIVKSIFTNHPKLFGITPGRAPLWLIKGSSNDKEPILNMYKENPRKENSVVFKKGLKAPTPCRGVTFKVCRVASDGFVSFGGSFYSIPIEKSRVGDFVRVVSLGSLLKIQTLFGHNIASHRIAESKGLFVENTKHSGGIEDHFRNITRYWVGYFDRRVGPISSNFVDDILGVGRKNLRKIWVLCGFVKSFGATEFESICETLKRQGKLSYGTLCRDIKAGAQLGKDALRKIDDVNSVLFPE